jgi:hypothetical protein
MFQRNLGSANYGITNYGDTLINTLDYAVALIGLPPQCRDTQDQERESSGD